MGRVTANNIFIKHGLVTLEFGVLELNVGDINIKCATEGSRHGSCQVGEQSLPK